MLGFSLLGDFYSFFHLFFSCFCRSGNDILCPSDLHTPGRCGLCTPCSQVALTAEECTGRILIYSGGLPLEKEAGMHALSIDSGIQVSIFLEEIVCVLVRRKTPQCSLLLPPWTGNLKGTQTLSSQVPLIGKVSKT